MKYSVKELSEISSVSVRTLHWYDEIGLLTPSRNKENGYREYSEDDINKLQEILFFRELGVELSEIEQLINADGVSRASILRLYEQKLLQKQNQITRLLSNVSKTILSEEGKYIMNNKEKFEAFKKDLVDANEKEHGARARELYTDDAVDSSNALLLQMGEEKYNTMQGLAQEINDLLKKAVCEKHSPQSEIGIKIAQKHKEWLSYTWKKYSTQAHIGLARTYLSDERFTQFYDNAACVGAAQFLHDAITAAFGND